MVKKCIFTIIDNICIKFQAIANELLESVKRMEDSLKKLQKVRQTSKSSANIAGHNRSSSGGVNMSDDDKIRLQLSIDIIELGNLLSSNFEGYKGGSNFELLTVIVEDINKTIASGNSTPQKSSLSHAENTIHMSESNSNFIVLEENETK